MKQIRINIEGMTCINCANRVAKALKEVPGVSEAVVSLADGMAEISAPGGIDPILLKAAVEKKGYGASIVE